MRLYAFLTLATCALHARAAAVPKLDVSDLQKKLAAVAQEAAKKEVLPIDNNPHPNQELTEQEIAVNEVQNSIKHAKIPGIPVTVVIEKDKVNDEKLDDIELDDGADIKRVEIDLKNPGAPQRQEHETQNPEHFEEPGNNMKQTVVDAQNNVQQGLQGVSQGIQDWIANNEQVTNIQQSLQSLQDNFKEQLSKLNQTVQSFLPQASNPANPSEKKAFENIDSTLRTLEDTFQRTVEKMADGVRAYALFAPSLRQATEGSGSGSTTTGGSASGGSSSNNNFFLQYLQALQTTISQGFANVTSTIQNSLTANGSGNGSNNTFAGPGSFISGIGSGIQNIFAQSTTPADSQSDESGSTTARPGWPIWQGIQSSLQNILSPGQNQASQNSTQAGGAGPIAQAIQNNPIVQAVGNFIQGAGGQQPVTQAPAQPESQADSQPAQSADPQPSSQEGSNAVPSEPKPSSEENAPQEGPIKKIIQNNPIMKGISGAVQKIQSIGNPEKPRDTLEGEQPDNEKGLFLYDKYGYGHGGHGGHGPNTGDNNDSSSSGEVAKSEPANVEPAKSEPNKPEPAKVDPAVQSEAPKESDKESIENPPQPTFKTE
ncbi:uncharacterized protein LOC106139612 [Amyelois transitella]|uniref:uncharacterized protein LOC106139612 n=1 Tax=Amyelois transitella TaxID=680683 RepID=UPI00298F70FB|nr:uncharacterized protein LOC106139612 [Amyelois transitella]